MTNLSDFYLNESNKLDGSNYANWKFKMHTLMKGHNVWAIINVRVNNYYLHFT